MTHKRPSADAWASALRSELDRQLAPRAKVELVLGELRRLRLRHGDGAFRAACKKALAEVP